MPGFNRQLIKRFQDIARPYWQSEEKWRARGLLALLMLLLFGQTTFNVLLNQQTGEFTSALAASDPARFWASSSRAFCTRVIRSWSRNGFCRKSKAPCCIASTAIGMSPWPVTKITGIIAPRRFSSSCSSGPLMPGMRTSSSRQQGWRCGRPAVARSASISSKASALA